MGDAFDMAVGQSAGISPQIPLPGTVVPEVPVSILHELQRGLRDIVDGHMHGVFKVVSDVGHAVIADVIDGTQHPHLLQLLGDTLDFVMRQQLETALAAAANLMRYEEEVHTCNHYYMDIVQDLRREILQDSTSDGEAVWKKRAFLQACAIFTSNASKRTPIFIRNFDFLVVYV